MMAFALISYWYGRGVPYSPIESPTPIIAQFCLFFLHALDACIATHPQLFTKRPWADGWALHYKRQACHSAGQVL